MNVCFRSTLSLLRLVKELRKVFLGVLFASLCRLANLLSDDLPLAVLVLLNGIEEGLALVLGELSVVHVLVPVLLDATLGTRGESLDIGLATVCTVIE